MFVRNHMTPDPVTVGPETPITELSALLDRHRIRHVPVVDQAGRLVGIVTDRDVRSATGYDHDGSLALKTEDIMTADPETIGGDAPLEDVLSRLCERRIGALPVLTNNRLIGIISRHDVLQAMSTILGLDRPGRRIEVALPDRNSDLATAFTALNRVDVELISAVAARVRDDGDEPALYLRVTGTHQARMESELKRAGLILLVPENELARKSP
jgi:acetoin utilization protein AcuB